MRDDYFKFSNAVLALPLFFVLMLWFVYWLEIRFDFDFIQNGIFPRTFSGLQGILFSPFIHSDLSHLYHNSIPLLVLLATLRYFYPNQTFGVIVFGILFSGFLTWVIGRASYHIGASGLIYVLVGYIFFKGIQTQYYRLVALSLTVVLVYGSMVWYIFPKVDDTISWEGHLAGLVSGFLLSLFYKASIYPKLLKYDWQQPDYDPSQDKFMQRFDAAGNFVNLPDPAEIQEMDTQYTSFFTSNTNVVYDFVEDRTVVNQKKESKSEF
jgi:membrane associated rhomboid family serine protease